jgi:hypothetical protein
MGPQAAPLTTSADNDRLLMMWLTAVSNMVQKFLDRELHIEDRVEYFTLSSRRKQFWVNAPPIITLTDVYVDLEGLYVGRESIIPNCFADEFNKAVRFPYAYWMEWTGVKSIRIRYNGGLAYHAVNSVYVMDSVASWVAGKYVRGTTSGAVGLVVSWVSGTKTLTVENYYGTFEVGETLSQYDAESGGSSSVSGALSSVTSRSLAETAPEIVMATDCQVRYMWKHTTDFENTGTPKDGGTIRQSASMSREWPLTEEVRTMLTPHIRMAIM